MWNLSQLRVDKKIWLQSKIINKQLIDNIKKKKYKSVIDNLFVLNTS